MATSFAGLECERFLRVGKLEAKGLQDNPRTLEALINKFRNVIHNITEGELSRVSKNSIRRCQTCFGTDGHSFSIFFEIQMSTM
jgi:hypothetical protein